MLILAILDKTTPITISILFLVYLHTIAEVQR